VSELVGTPSELMGTPPELVGAPTPPSAVDVMACWIIHTQASARHGVCAPSMICPVFMALGFGRGRGNTQHRHLSMLGVGGQEAGRLTCLPLSSFTEKAWYELDGTSRHAYLRA